MSKTVEGHSIFGAYSQPENQVTYALLKILEGDQEKGEMLDDIVRLSGGEALPPKSISIEAQYTKGDTSNTIPDGHLSCGYAFDIFIESKLSDCINDKQLQGHLDIVKEGKNQMLLYITTHSQRPKELPSHVLWTNWTKLMNLLSDYRADTGDVIRNYLIDQFELLLNEYNLCDKYEERVIVVGGAWGEPIACKYGFYACQGNRHFRKAKYIAFYHSNRIAHLFEIVEGPMVIDIRERDDIDDGYFIKEEPHYKPERRTYFKLKPVEEFNGPIINDTKDKNGKPWAFTIGTTYTTLQQIMNATKTSELK